MLSFEDPYRITSSIGAFRIQLEGRVAQCKARGEVDLSWAEHARQLLQQSDAALGYKDVDGAWRYLRAAERMELYGLMPEELRVRAKVLAIEVQAKEELRDWRRDSVLMIVGQDRSAAGTQAKGTTTGPSSPPQGAKGLDSTAGATEVQAKEELRDWRRDSVLMIVRQVRSAAGTQAEGTTTRPSSPSQGAEGLDSTAGATELAADHIAYAFQLRDEHFDKQGYRLTMLREKLTVLLIVLLLAVVVVLVLFGAWQIKGTPLTLSADRGVDGAINLAAVALFGFLGASLSAITSLAQLSTGTRIPHPRFLTFTTMMRPVVGAAAALGLYVFLASGLLNLGPLTVGRVLAASFAAGFSERFIIRTVESVAGQSRESGRPPSNS